MRAADRFNQIYHTDPMYHTFTPYRICPLGAHSDHQLGKITGFAIDKGTNHRKGEIKPWQNQCRD